ncbi:helix-turn-helix domain-containing protein [Photobacterium japonica]|uniref:winged helix-turn-helix domain-containing protein n=1 Tax=Photobacterium japonica TaxID=2910235 RepID=UPI003D108D18
MHEEHNNLIVGAFSWNVDTRNLQRITDTASSDQKQSVMLTPKQYQLLRCLVDAFPQTLQKEHIIEKVWGTKHISAESLPQLINRTRQVLEDNEKQILVNVPGVGYSLQFKVTPVTDKKTDDIENLKKVQKVQINQPLNKRKILIERLSILFIVFLTALSIWNMKEFILAVHYKQVMQEIQHAKPYPDRQPIDETKISITIDNHKCIYDNAKFLLKCQ